MVRNFEKRALTIVIACTFFFSAAFCAYAAGKEFQYIFATGPTGGTFFPLGGVIAQSWNKSAEVNVTAVTTAAGFENLRMLEKNEAMFALLPESISYFGATGTGIAQKLGEKFESYSVIGRIYPEPVQIFARKDSNIKNIGDFKGKKVSMGAQGGYQHILGMQVFELAGLKTSDYSQSFTGYSVAADQFQDKMIDGGFFLTGLPNSTLAQLAINPGIRLLPVSDEIITKLQKEIPFASKMVIPANSYSSMNEDTPSLSIWTLLLVRKDLPGDVAYKMTKILFEQAQEMGKTNAQAKWIDLKNQKNLSLPIHPGAQKYYSETAK